MADRIDEWGFPLIFTEDDEPATSSGYWRKLWIEQRDRSAEKRTCPWCGLLCESVEAELEHEEVCDG